MHRVVRAEAARTVPPRWGLLGLVPALPTAAVSSEVAFSPA